MADPNRSYDYVMSFVAQSDQYKSQYTDRWREVLANFMVHPVQNLNVYTSPFRANRSQMPSRDQIMLKDPETHQAIMTYASKLVRTVMGDRRREYIKARPVGWEDAQTKSPTVTRLLRYAFSLPGSFRTMVEGVIDMLLFGTAVIEVGWDYRAREAMAREVTVDPMTGMEISTDHRIPWIQDDVLIRGVDINDFFPDPGRYRMQDMCGAAKRFRVNAMYAKQAAQNGLYDSAAVNRAIQNQAKSSSPKQLTDNFREDIDQPRDARQHAELKDMIGYEYWGDVPWVTDGSSRRVITVLNNEVVRDDPWPLADPELPFKTLIINPVQGRFYGISPAEVIRFDQEYADAIKVLLATAIIRQVHPPIAYDPESDIDLAKLKVWKADVPIGVRGGPNAIGTLRYDANIANGFSMLQGLKSSMQSASGALGAIQGQEGPDRESATVGANRIQMAMDRPELAAMVLEQECLPPIGIAILRRYQQFLDGTEDLKSRIGEIPEPAWLGDIMGEFDVEFVGSRVAMTRQEKLQAYDRLISMASAVPQLVAMIPWDSVGKEMIGDLLELPELAAQIGDPMAVLKNIMLAQQIPQGPGGGVQASEPAGAMPAQMSGNVPGA